MPRGGIEASLFSSGYAYNLVLNLNADSKPKLFFPIAERAVYYTLVYTVVFLSTYRLF